MLVVAAFSCHAEALACLAALRWRAGTLGSLNVTMVTYPKNLEGSITVLRDVDLDINEGELVAIVGPSGSGKTTLLHVLGTLDGPSSGRVLITGLDVARLSDRELATLRATRIGFVFQQFFLAEHLTALDNVADGLLYTGIGHRDRRHHAARALAAVELGDRLDARPTQLSGGQRQRVAIARALVGQPAILLADEPTGNLDGMNAAQVFELMLELNRELGTSLVIVTHDERLAARLDRVLVLADGILVERAGAPV
jgi:putative ABC transport system ATP-binding protein